MTDKTGEQGGRGQVRARKRERLEAQLRANLQRRKAQARVRAAAEDPADNAGRDGADAPAAADGHGKHKDDNS